MMDVLLPVYLRKNIFDTVMQMTIVYIASKTPQLRKIFFHISSFKNDYRTNKILLIVLNEHDVDLWIVVMNKETTATTQTTIYLVLVHTVFLMEKKVRIMYCAHVVNYLHLLHNQ